MKKNFVFFSLATLLVMVFTSISFAGALDTFGLGSKATSLGGAFAAYADDPFAIYYNPAGLVQMDSMTVSQGIHTAYPVIKINKFHVEPGTMVRNVAGSVTNIPLTDPMINGYKDVSNDSAFMPAPHFGVAYPLSDKLVAGFGVYAPFGAEASWNSVPGENPTAFSGTYSKYVRIVASPTIAYKINDQFFLGAGLSIGNTEVKSERFFYIPPVIYKEIENGYNAFSTDPKKQKAGAAMAANGQKVIAELLDPFNYSFNLGLMWKPAEAVTLGLTYRSQAKVALTGSVEIEGLKEDWGTMADGSPIKSKVDADTQMDTPAQIQAGVRVQPKENFSIEIDYLWTNWSIIKDNAAYFTPKLMDNKSSETLARDWENTSQIRLGLEYKADDFITVRGGYFFDPTPVPESTFDMGSTDVDKTIYSFGLGMNFGKLTVDAVYQYTTSEKRQIGDIAAGSDPFNYVYNFTYDQDLKAEGVGQHVSCSAKMQVWAFGITGNYTF